MPFSGGMRQIIIGLHFSLTSQGLIRIIFQPKQSTKKREQNLYRKCPTKKTPDKLSGKIVGNNSQFKTPSSQSGEIPAKDK